MSLQDMAFNGSTHSSGNTSCVEAIVNAQAVNVSLLLYLLLL